MEKASPSSAKANGKVANGDATGRVSASAALDEAMRPFVEAEGSAIRRVGENLYHIHEERRAVVLRNEQLLLRVGGGFMALSEYLHRHTPPPPPPPPPLSTPLVKTPKRLSLIEEEKGARLW